MDTRNKRAFNGPSPYSYSKSKSNAPIPKQPKPEPLEKCTTDLFSKLENLKKAAILRQSLSPSDDTSEFEILEFYGDSVLYERISSFLMQTRRFFSPHLLTKLRTAIICNRSLALCFDLLKVSALMTQTESLIDMKQKADVIEAIIGELSEAASRPNQSLAKNVLDELLSYIHYHGEQTYFSENSSAPPVATNVRHAVSVPAMPPTSSSPPSAAPVSLAPPLPAPAPATASPRTPIPSVIPPRAPRLVDVALPMSLSPAAVPQAAPAVPPNATGSPAKPLVSASASDVPRRAQTWVTLPPRTQASPILPLASPSQPAQPAVNPLPAPPSVSSPDDASRCTWVLLPPRMRTDGSPTAPIAVALRSAGAKATTSVTSPSVSSATSAACADGVVIMDGRVLVPN